VSLNEQPAPPITVFPEEAHSLSFYLVGRSCAVSVADDYALAVSVLGVNLNLVQEKMYVRMLKSRLLMGAIDGGLAFVKRDSALRKRIFVMLCLLEASPLYTESFLPRKRSFMYLLALGLKILCSFGMALVGALIIKLKKIE